MNSTMKIKTAAILAVALALPATAAEDPMQQHREGAEKVAIEQDELGADVQQLVMEQTIEQVIALLDEVQDIMIETTDLLVEYETGGVTLAAQTEVIEKIHEAAKERQKQSGSGESGGAMMDMLERMMGKQPGEGEGEGEGEGQGEGEGEGEQGGQGQTGDSDSANERTGGSSNEFTEERRVPKAGGVAGRALPPEFRPALEAYNRGMEDLDQP